MTNIQNDVIIQKLNLSYKIVPYGVGKVSLLHPLIFSLVWTSYNDPDL